MHATGRVPTVCRPQGRERARQRAGSGQLVSCRVRSILAAPEPPSPTQSNVYRVLAACSPPSFRRSCPCCWRGARTVTPPSGSAGARGDNIHCRRGLCGGAAPCPCLPLPASQQHSAESSAALALPQPPLRLPCPPPAAREPRAVRRPHTRPFHPSIITPSPASIVSACPPPIPPSTQRVRPGHGGAAPGGGVPRARCGRCARHPRHAAGGGRAVGVINNTSIKYWHILLWLT